MCIKKLNTITDAIPKSVPPTETVIEMLHVSTAFGDHVVHKDINLSIYKGEIFAIIGGSGSGKSTLLREIILLQKPSSGDIKVLGIELNDINQQDTLTLCKRWGVMFQHGGLFGALTVKENIGLPLREHTNLSSTFIDEIADAKLLMTGLSLDVGRQYPAELSGGMLKRASLARALALDPELLFLDEPTAGLDPASAEGVDKLILQLRAHFGLTIIMITHDLDLLWQVADRVAILADKRVQAIDSMQALAFNNNDNITPFFNGPRARSAYIQHTANSK